MLLLACTVLASNAYSYHTQIPAEAYTQVLIPVPPSTAGRPGANGANWVTRIVISNDSNVPVQAFFHARYPFTLDPGKARIWGEVLYLHGPIAPFFLYVKSEFSDHVHFHLRSADTSREALSFGTEIPVIREKEARTGKIDLMDVPVDTRFRRTLRIYGGFGHTTLTEAITMTVRVFPLESDQLLSESVVTLAWGGGPYPFYPAYREFDPVPSGSTLSTERVRIQLEPVNQTVRYWAFLTVTNNETNHITTITPQ